VDTDSPHGGTTLPPGEFYIPSLRGLAMPPGRPVPVTRFVARFAAVFSGDADRPQRLDYPALGDLAERLHLLALGDSPESAIFERFAPRYSKLLGFDLTGMKVTDARFRPYNTDLPDQLQSIAARRSPFYAQTRIDELPGERTSHRIFVPMSNRGGGPTHCLLFSFNHQVM
jgi:hypothetical protein